MKTCLSIAGFDGSGGAGIQADLKVFSAFGCYGMTVLTALPVQNTMGVRSVYELPLQSIPDQLAAIFDDIRPDAIKIGMLFNAPIIQRVVEFLKLNAGNIPIVIDPVMLAKSGDTLLLPEAVASLRDELLPLATVVTPNLPEAMALTGVKADSNDEMLAVAQKLISFGPRAVLLKGGHLAGNESNDLYLDHSGAQFWLNSPRIETKNTHGTGCTLSAAIAACLALGLTLEEACRTAKHYLNGALAAAEKESVGHGHGPLHHFHHIWPTLERIRA